MAAWITVYCRRSTGGVTAESLRTALQACDLYTATESFGLNEVTVDAAIPYLDVRDISNGIGERFRVYYRPDDVRQVDITLWTEPKAVEETLNEADELIKTLDINMSEIIIQRLKETIAVVGVGIGWVQLENRDHDMGTALASEVAMYIAREMDGVIRDWDDAWWVIAKSGQFKQVN